MKRTILTLLLLCSGLALADDAKLRGGNMLACETYSFRTVIRAKKLDMLGVPQLYKELGIKGISYNDMFFESLDDDYIDRIKAAVKKADRVVTCFIMEGNLALANEELRRKQIETDKQKLRVAKRLGAPLVRINVGRTDKQENADDTAGLERVIAAFKEMLPLAKELGIRISIENHGGVSAKADNIVKIIQATDPKWVGSLVDFGNFPADARYEEIAKVAPYALTTHVKVGGFDENGEAKGVDLPRVFAMLKKYNYKGPISIEYGNEPDPAGDVKKTRALILKYW
ncbi:MAG: sugar phosphate isomerase/epimerase [Acidobacteria bacterium]|nr:sugar phosphate isomerase/epimerase [Acidobacteriota bacterium]